jgi:tetratricopeptide (TPR) repeat protein
MITAQTLHATQYRLAEYYLNKLRQAALSVRQGNSGVQYGLTILDREWSHIQQWQRWSASHQPPDNQRAHLCKEFSLAGSDVLAMRQIPRERLQWFETALEAAQQVHDRAAELVILTRLSGTYSTLGELEKAGQMAKQLLELAVKGGDVFHTGKAFYLLGTVAEDQGKHKEATRCYQRAVRIFSKARSDVDLGRALLGLGSLATDQGDYLNAYGYFLRYLKLVENGGKDVDLCFALQALSEALRNLRRFDEAEAHLQRCIQLARSLDYRWVLGTSLMMLGSCALDQNHLQSAETTLQEALIIERTYSSKRDVIHCLSSLGYVRFRQGDFEGALRHLQEALDMAREAGLPRYVCDVLRRMTDAYLARDDLDSTRYALLETMTLAQSLDLIPERVKAVVTAIAFWHRLGKSQQAAIWAGSVMGHPEIDEDLFRPVCLEMEATLGADCFQQALAQGKTLTLDTIVAVIVQTLDQSQSSTLSPGNP